MVRRRDLEANLKALGEGEPPTIAAWVKRAERLEHVHPDHSLHMALERLGSSGLDVIPVVSRANERELVGIAVLADILAAYGVHRTGVQQIGVQGSKEERT
jgi:CBS domain-containing protein